MADIDRDPAYLATIAFRNIISHDYAAIVPRFIWAAAHELDAIEAMCRTELANSRARSGGC